MPGVSGMQMPGAPPLPGMPPGMPSMGAGAHSGMPGLSGMMHGMSGAALHHTPNTPHRTPNTLRHIATTWRDAWGMPFREMRRCVCVFSMHVQEREVDSASGVVHMNAYQHKSK